MLMDCENECLFLYKRVDLQHCFFISFAGDVWAVVHHDVPKVSEEDSLLLQNALEIEKSTPDLDSLTLVTAVMRA